MKIRVLCALLAVLLVIPMLFSCSDNSTDSKETVQSTTGKVSEYAYIDDYVSDLAAGHKFGGATFNII